MSAQDNAERLLGLLQLTETINAVPASGSGTVALPDVTAATQNWVTLTANPTFAFPAVAAGKSLLLALTQDLTGSRTVSWPASVKWPGATAPTLTSTPGKTDVLSFVAASDGMHWLGFVSGQNF
jgi:endonuclease/exonuclease/phosphatase (EEP) superfamily protein YafD